MQFSTMTLTYGGAELELELIQSHMAQKPMLRGEVGARALRVAPTKPKDWQTSFFVKFVVLIEPHEVGYSSI